MGFMNREYLQKRGKEIGKERSETRGARSASKASTPRSKALISKKGLKRSKI
jgi:hypothetical protein